MSLADCATHQEPVADFAPYRKEVRDEIGGQCLYVPEQSSLRQHIDVIARFTEKSGGNEHYTPIAREENFVMFGYSQSPETWTRDLGDMFIRIASELCARKSEPFSIATFEITKPGSIAFTLDESGSVTAQGQDAKSFFFKFRKPTRFEARIKHSGSGHLIATFNNRQGEADHPIRKKLEDTGICEDSKDHEDIEISLRITKQEIESMGEFYWELRVSNYDKTNDAECTLEVEYEDASEASRPFQKK